MFKVNSIYKTAKGVRAEIEIEADDMEENDPTKDRQFFAPFENDIVPFVVQAREASRVRLLDVSEFNRSGVELLTLPGDTDIAGSNAAERCDLYLPRRLFSGEYDEEQWWSHSILFPTNYVSPPGWGVVFDFHNTNPGPGQANFHVDADNEGLGLRGYGGNQLKPEKFGVRLGGITRNIWYDFLYHVYWSAQKGFFRAWVNGFRVLDYTGPTLYTEQGVYVKLANYHVSPRQPSAVIHGPVACGKTRESVLFR